MFLRIALSLALTAGTVAISAAPALAGAPQLAVSTAGLNLSSEAGQRELSSRLRRAATSVCFDDRVRDLGSQMAGYDCRTQALAAAHSQLRTALARAGVEDSDVAAE